MKIFEAVQAISKLHNISKRKKQQQVKSEFDKIFEKCFSVGASSQHVT